MPRPSIIIIVPRPMSVFACLAAFTRPQKGEEERPGIEAIACLASIPAAKKNVPFSSRPGIEVIAK